MSSTIHTHEFLTADECGQVAATVDGLRPYWEKNSPYGRLYVLGAPSYIHAGRPAGDAYHGRARRLTPILHRHFGWMYDRLCASLSAALGGPTRLAEGLGPPGFHHYRWDPHIAKLRCSVHLDLQWESHDFSRFGKPDLANPLSFTVALRLPASGAGMNAWSSRRRAELESLTPRYVRYGLGELTMHSGMFFHQIAPIELAPEESRLTLQGHAIRCDDTWQLYW